MRNCKKCGKELTTKRNFTFCSKGCATSYRQDARDPNFLTQVSEEYIYYVLGFVFGDGCLTQGKLVLSSKDLELVSKIKQFYSPNRKTYSKKPAKETHSECYSLVTTNKEVIEFFINKGIIERKSKVVKLPKLTEEQTPHFIRGYFDADGSIWLNNVGGFTYKHLGFTTGSKVFAEELTILLNNIGFDFTLTKDSRSEHGAYYVKLYKQKQVKEFGNWIYKNSNLHLERKRKIFYDDIV